ncbi:hypothetical protein M8J76_008021 [Diaphorina citri]|nr:hypothetical protein M8J76_008021 [Diaphorina citri]
MAKTYPPPSSAFTFKGFMAPVHCVMVDENILFAGTQEGKIHLWNLQTYREVFTLTASTQPVLSIHKTDDHILIQDKEMTISVWKYKVENSSNAQVSLKEINCFKRSEPKLSFCKCIVFNSNLDNYFNKFGNIIDRNTVVGNPYLEHPSVQNRNSYYTIVPYDSKEITMFSLESRKKMTVIDITKESQTKLSDVIMCMKLISVNTELYLILCTEDGYLTLYNVKLKCIECQIKLNTEITNKKKTRCEKSGDEKEECLEERLDLKVPDVPMVIDFDAKTMRGIVGTNSANLYCIKLYLGISGSSEDKSTPGSKDSLKSQLNIKMLLELRHSGVSCLSIRPDGKLFVLSFWDGNGIYIYNWNNLKCISFIDYVYKSIHDLYFFNNMLAVACDGGKVSLWKFHS